MLATEARQRQCVARPRQQHSPASPYSFLSGGPISVPGQQHSTGLQGYRLDRAFKQEETNNVGSREFMETKYDFRENIDYFGKSTGSNRFSYYLSNRLRNE